MGGTARVAFPLNRHRQAPYQKKSTNSSRPSTDVNPRRLFSLVEFGGFVESRNKDKVQDKYVWTAGGTVPLRMGPGIYNLLTVSRVNNKF